MVSVKTLLRSAVEYSGTGSWLYTKRTLEWTKSHEVVRQLPPWMRIFCAYARTYNRLVGTRTILLGHRLFRWAQVLDGKRLGPTPLLIAGRTTWLDLRDPGFLWAIQELAFGSDQTRLIAGLASQADLFVDVGANQGIFSAISNSAMPPGARIIAIEPQPSLAKCIEASLSSTPHRRGQVQQVVVCDNVGELELFVPDENMGQAHVASDSTTGNMRVTSTTLDLLLADVPSGTRVLLKMDIEGSELAALVGGQEFLQRCRPTLILEINPDAMRRYGYCPGDIARFLQGVGYESWALVGSPEACNSMGCFPEVYCDIVLQHAEASS